MDIIKTNPNEDDKIFMCKAHELTYKYNMFPNIISQKKTINSKHVDKL